MNKSQWKKNIKVIPQRVFDKLKNIDSPDIVVFASKEFTAEKLKDNVLSHLDIKLSERGLTYPKEILPLDNQGICSCKNANGYEIIRKDLGKQTVGYVTIEAPNWRGYGTHEVSRPIKGYPRDHISPTNYTIKIEALSDKPNQSKYIIKFEINNVLKKGSSYFENDLFFCLNLLQENVGAFDVAEAGMKFSEYIKTIHLSWEILPPGQIDKALELIFKGKKPTKKTIDDTTDRLKFFQSLKPKNLIVGTSGFVRYSGALIKNDLVVFDNMSYGNAIYIMFKNWEELSQKSKTELLNGRCYKDFVRIPHISDWRVKVQNVIKERKK